MKRHLNTLFVTTEGSYLAKEGQAVLVRVEKETRLRVPLINLDGIVCFGRVGASPSLLGACAEAGVSVSLMNRHGRLRACVLGFLPGNVLLRRAQYRASDDSELSARIARTIVAAKIANCRSVLLRGARDSRSTETVEALQQVASTLENPLREVRTATTVDSARGHEGNAAAGYFAVFNRWTVAAAVRHSMPSIRCCLSCTACCVTMPAAPARRSGWIPRWGSCTVTVPAVLLLRSI